MAVHWHKRMARYSDLVGYACEHAQGGIRELNSCRQRKGSRGADANHLRPPGVLTGGWLALLPVAVALAVAVAVVAPGVGWLATPTELRMAEAEPPSGAGAGVGVLLFFVPVPAVQAQAPKTA